MRARRVVGAFLVGARRWGLPLVRSRVAIPPASSPPPGPAPRARGRRRSARAPCGGPPPRRPARAPPRLPAGVGGGAPPAGVLDEVGVLGREAGAADLQSPALRGIEE